MPVTADLAKLLDKRYEKADLRQLINAPVSAIARVSDDADLGQSGFSIKTVGDLGRHKAARALSGSPSPRGNAS